MSTINFEQGSMRRKLHWGERNGFPALRPFNFGQIKLVLAEICRTRGSREGVVALVHGVTDEVVVEDDGYQLKTSDTMEMIDEHVLKISFITVSIIQEQI